MLNNQFVELTYYISGEKFLLNKSSITTIGYDQRAQYSDRLVIGFGLGGDDDYIWVKEDYEEVKKLLYGRD